jgi:hypothetical protein
MHSSFSRTATLMLVLACSLLLAAVSPVAARTRATHCKAAHGSCGKTSSARPKAKAKTKAASKPKARVKPKHKPSRRRSAASAAHIAGPITADALVPVCDDQSTPDLTDGTCADGTPPMFCGDGSTPDTDSWLCASGTDPLSCDDGSVPASAANATCADGTTPDDAYSPVVETGTCDDGSTPDATGTCADGSAPTIDDGLSCDDGSTPQPDPNGDLLCADGTSPS